MARECLNLAHRPDVCTLNQGILSLLSKYDPNDWQRAFTVNDSFLSNRATISISALDNKRFSRG